MERTEWHSITEKDQLITGCVIGGYEGKVSLMTIQKITVPFRAEFDGKWMTLADAGCSWLQLAMEKDFAWFTVMFDDHGRFLQIYADLTCGNRTEADIPEFEDLFLDYVVCDGSVKQLDMNELKAANKEGVISDALYRKALEEGNRLYEMLVSHTGEIVSFFTELYQIMNELKRKTGDLPKLHLDLPEFLKEESVYE